MKFSKQSDDNGKVIVLAGNPNVGKSTVFNALTGMHQHTGNWTGKTVSDAKGVFEYKKQKFILMDIPGTYSLHTHSKEEEIARDFLVSGDYDAVIVVCDATCLERNLNLVLQTIEITDNVIVCVNLLDEAKKKGIEVDLKMLSESLGVKVVGTSAKNKKGLESLQEAVFEEVFENKNEALKENEKNINQNQSEYKIISERFSKAENIAKLCVNYKNKEYNIPDLKTDRILTGRFTGIPAMILLLGVVFWITIYGANIPSAFLSENLFRLQDILLNIAKDAEIPEIIYSPVIFGVYRVVAWVVSVMLPPMAIFFPLFTFLEDLGYLPRIAFNLDKGFKKCSACGKQALTMCMGFGCNAAAVTGCRIIDSPRERLIAILTNSFVPCNGRFPTLIAIITMFFTFSVSGILRSVWGAVILMGIIILSILMTFLASKFLSKTILSGETSFFTLELPPYRTPNIGSIIVRSCLDRTLFVLGRAVTAAAPAGLIIWLFANITVGDMTLLSHCSGFLDPFAKVLGLDGVILLAFILGIPANEIVIPIMIMAYMSYGTITDFENLMFLKELLLNNGWTYITAINTMIFSLFHWPCATTIMTIHKETKSIKWTLFSVILPTLCGTIICFIVNSVFIMFT